MNKTASFFGWLCWLVYSEDNNTELQGFLMFAGLAMLQELK